MGWTCNMFINNIYHLINQLSWAARTYHRRMTFWQVYSNITYIESQIKKTINSSFGESFVQESTCSEAAVLFSVHVSFAILGWSFLCNLTQLVLFAKHSGPDVCHSYDFLDNRCHGNHYCQLTTSHYTHICSHGCAHTFYAFILYNHNALCSTSYYKNIIRPTRILHVSKACDGHVIIIS